VIRLPARSRNVKIKDQAARRAPPFRFNSCAGTAVGANQTAAVFHPPVSTTWFNDALLGGVIARAKQVFERLTT
jgi:hypothetical protein